MDTVDVAERSNAEPGEILERGVLPATGFIFGAGVDCQDDRLEVQLVAFGRNRRRWVIDYKVIPHHIGDDEGRAALNALLRQSWSATAWRVGLAAM